MKEIPTLTVFTPTYNRAHTLVRTYESLCRQTSKDFEWLIIDDGSADNTEQLVLSWLCDNIIPIRYIKKDNGGLHTGYNAAIANLRTEINVCIDSDDYMPDDAVQIMIDLWKKFKNDEVAGLVGLDYTMTGEPIGGKFTKTGRYHFYDISSFHSGDTKIVCRTDVLQRIPQMQSFGKEKNFNPIVYYMQVDKDFSFEIVNENFCIVDYQLQGMSAGIFFQYRNSPRSFAEIRRIAMRMPYYNLKSQLINAGHYVSSSLFAKDWSFLKSSPRPLLTICAFPLGVLMNLYIRYKTRN